MILAGIDEAGYGPLLGPLVVGCCAFELPDIDGAAPLPCLWQRLRKLVSKTRNRSGRKLHINDSKQVYSPSAGLLELERSILAVAMSLHPKCDSLTTLLQNVSPHVMDQLAEYRWYSQPESNFPFENQTASVQIFANALRLEMQRTQTQCVHLGARVVLERQLNQMMAATRNKAMALFSTAAIHLDHLLRTYGEKGLVIVCDRQGGREHYGSLLRTMFEEWDLEVTSEIEGRSEYRLTRNGHAARIIFTEKAEAQAMPVAVASMLCKYLRETLMHRFNEFWKQHIPTLNPTAGYYVDGERFLRDIAEKRAELAIDDFDLIRSR